MEAAKAEKNEVAQEFGLTRYMTLDEVCTYARCSKRHIMQEIKRKNLKVYKPVRELIFDPHDVQAWIKRKVK